MSTYVEIYSEMLFIQKAKPFPYLFRNSLALRSKTYLFNFTPTTYLH